jgi:hypothetical protein
MLLNIKQKNYFKKSFMPQCNFFFECIIEHIKKCTIMNDPISFKASVQKGFENKTIRQINRTIFLIKVVNLFNNEGFVFLFTFLSYFIGIHLVAYISLGSLIFSIIYHLALFHFYYKKALLKDKDIKHNENLFFIECLEELKKDKN